SWSNPAASWPSPSRWPCPRGALAVRAGLHLVAEKHGFGCSARAERRRASLRRTGAGAARLDLSIEHNWTNDVRGIKTISSKTGGSMNFEVDIADEGKQGFAVAIYSVGSDAEEGALEFGRSGIEGKQAVLQ